MSKLTCDRLTNRQRVWFTTPTVVLAEQQYESVKLQLPQFRSRTLLGHDNVELWQKRIWEKALDGCHIIISTPQVLLDALRHAFVFLRDISLLVIDEAHHCRADSSLARVMREIYHPQISQNGDAVPHILGLTASPLMNCNEKDLGELELTLDATCKSPTRSVTEYQQYVHIPQLVCLHHPYPSVPSDTVLRAKLRQIVHSTTMSSDPYYQYLSNAEDLASTEKLRKCKEKRKTPAMVELETLLRHADHILEALGPWACDDYIYGCVLSWHENMAQNTFYIPWRSKVSSLFIDQRLEPLRRHAHENEWQAHRVAAKASALIEFLEAEYCEGISAVVFVERRSAAHALCRLLRNCPQLTQYRVFSFVGLATSRRQSLFEIAGIGEQSRAFAEFRAGTQNICVATAVAEEGIDIQAVNLVIRFDEPKTLISYIQSRGRARKQYSKFVHFTTDDQKSQDRYSKWAQLEADMKAQYQNEMRQLADRQRTEAEDETGDETCVSVAGALLNYRNARAHLQYFCSTLARPADPIMILSRPSERGFTAKVVLPSCLAVELRRFVSRNTWTTEKLAKRDVSFQAVKRLHEVNLIDDHFMPPRSDKIYKQSAKHGARMHTICASHEVWHASEAGKLYQYLVEASCGREEYASIIIVLPRSLRSQLCFELHETAHRILDISVTPNGVYNAESNEQATTLTRQLFQQIFGPGSARTSLDDTESIPFICAPAGRNDFDGEDPAISFAEAPFIRGLFEKQPLLLWSTQRPRPFLHVPSRFNATCEEQVQVTRIRKAQILTRTKSLADSVTSQVPVPLSLNRCLIRACGTVYGPTMLLIPSVLEVVSAALRAQEAHNSILKDIGLSTTELLTPALLAKSAVGTVNYERLEYLGDALLKFYASMHMFATLPLATEGVLTEKVAQLVSNMSLESATLRLGLERFITTESTPSKHWKLPSASGKPKPDRQVLSKTFADVIESTLAAAYLDTDAGNHAGGRLLQALNLLLPEISWESIDVYVTACLKGDNGSVKSMQVPRQLRLVRDMLGHAFKHQHLLIEALTHSCHATDRQSLDRLECLGDAIIDKIIKERLYHQQPPLSAARMTLCRHALAAHALFAYLALGVSGTEQVNEIFTGEDGRITYVEQTNIVNLVDLIIIDGRDDRVAVQEALHRRQKLDSVIPASLNDRIMPWTKLYAINAPKVCSDIFESLVAAVFIDSNGSFAACENVLNKIGLLALVDRIARDDGFDVSTSTARLNESYTNPRPVISSTKIKSSEDLDKTVHRGRIHLADELLCETEEVSNKDEAENMAAEMALDILAARQLGKADKTTDPAGRSASESEQEQKCDQADG